MLKLESKTISEVNKIKEVRIALIIRKMDAKKKLTKEEKKELKAFEDGQLEALVKKTTAKYLSKESKPKDPNLKILSLLSIWIKSLNTYIRKQRFAGKMIMLILKILTESSLP